MSNLIHESKEYKIVATVLSNLNIPNVVMGGYPRDLASGREPKDLDICVYSTDIHSKSWKVLVSMLNELDMLDSRFLGMPEYQDSRVLEVIKLKCKIDIVVWNRQSILEIINSFDYNINQWLLIDERPTFFGDNFGVLTQIKAEGYNVSELREQHIIAIAQELNWDVEECQKQTQTPPLIPQPIPLPTK